MTGKLISAFSRGLFWVTLLSFAHLSAKAQPGLKERRVYYLDATYSMVTPSKLWDPVRNDLAKAIDAIEDETTEIYVVAFGGEGGTNLQTWHNYATASGKKEIISGFNSKEFKPKTNTMTYLDRPLNDFYTNKVDPNKVTYCFLMTDGKDENDNPSIFPNALKKWGDRYGKSNVYGFYVMLNKEAKDKNIESIIENQPHLWKVETANININMIRLDNYAVFNVRNDNRLEIPISGKSDGLKFSASLPESSGLKVKNCKVHDGKLIVNIDVVGNKSVMPSSSTHKLSVSVSNARQFDFLVTDNVYVKCNNKKELVVFSPTDRQNLGRVSHYDEFLFVPGRIVPIKKSFDFQFNDDAKADKTTFAEFAFVDNSGNAIMPKDMIVTVDGQQLKKNQFQITPSHNKVDIEISFPSGAKKGKHQGYLRMINHNMHRLNNNECAGQKPADAFQWTVYNSKTMNPLAKILMWLSILTLSVMMLWFIVIKPIKYPRFSKFRKMVLIKNNGVVAAQFTCNFKGARRVIFATKKQPQSLLNRLFTGRIETIVNPFFEEPITFLPRKKKAVAKGKGYFFNPNPIPQSGVAEITAPAKKLTINLQ